MHILHINYETKHAPLLDNYIFEALEGIIEDMDCMRDDETRDIYLYFQNEKELNSAIELLEVNGGKPIEDNEEGLTLLDFIRIIPLLKDTFQENKIKIRKRINEIYQKYLLKNSIVEESVSGIILNNEREFTAEISGMGDGQERDTKAGLE